MNPLDLYSEPYGSTGNIGENFRRLLGAPSLDPLQTVIREAVQNIADAAVFGREPEILIRLRILSQDQREILSNIALHNMPFESSSRELLQAMFSRRALAVLEICDFYTTGLGGPTRSDRVPIGTERTDFIDFMRNIGTPRDSKCAGGTYGFGKVALYRASRCSSILVDSLPHGCGTDGRLLIGCHVGRSFDVPENGMHRRFTGRHWWGVADEEDGITDPVTGYVAAKLAAELGFPVRTCSGTSIMILDFDIENDDLRAVGNRVAETLLWNFWPRMMRDVPANNRFKCRVEADGSEIHIPAPEELAPFDLFCKAMRAARGRSGNDVRPIEALRPAKFLGTLAIERGLRSPRRPLVEPNSVVPPVIHHIALMRPVELVVKYLAGSPLPDERLEWAGVFIVSSEDEVENAFADAEPPAHDDWIPDNLPKGSAKSYVNIALKRLRTIAVEMGVIPLVRPIVSNSALPLARLAGRLGAVLEDVGGDGARRRRSAGGGVGSPRSQRARAVKPFFERLELGDEGRIAVFRTEVIQATNRTVCSLHASASIAIDGVSVGLIDDEIRQPVVLCIKEVEGELMALGSRLNLQGREGWFEVWILVPGEYAVTVDAEVLPESAV
ncbi:hypothetical protein KQ307_07210 [Synechococcus sp. CS-1326]|uniref:hypothetical protein n=1 Tax=Synechococcus sp. CS-1326 TaxID=2847978 RepID=UPI00223A84D5|nr:hypothetical protein [Synechococcus sp. CS-1326]MCT0213280.1 hypothetical protein [Synechococcus sp. CS-1326]